MSDSLGPHGLWHARLLCLWDFPVKSTGVGSHFLLQEIFPTQGWNHFYTSFIGRQILYHCATWETHIGYYKILNIVPCAIQWVLIIYFIYSSVSLFILIC